MPARLRAGADAVVLRMHLLKTHPPPVNQKRPLKTSPPSVEESATATLRPCGPRQKASDAPKRRFLPSPATAKTPRPLGPGGALCGSAKENEGRSLPPHTAPASLPLLLYFCSSALARPSLWPKMISSIQSRAKFRAATSPSSLSCMTASRRAASTSTREKIRMRSTSSRNLSS